MKQSNSELGRRGEELARKHLKRNGYRIVGQNYRTRLGEIDIIAREKGTLAFVEVKTRMGSGYGKAAEAITDFKKIQLSKVALEYLAKNNLFDTPARFDVVGIEFDGPQKYRIEIIRNAFDLAYGL